MGRDPEYHGGGATVARPVSLVPDSPAAWGGYAVALVTFLFTWLRDRRKNDIDESALVLGKWKELVEQHQSAIKDIRAEFAAYKTTAMQEVADLRHRLRGAEKRISELEAENTGLKRAIAQNSQSAAYQIGKVRSVVVDDAMDDVVERLDQAGHNRKGGV